MFGVRIGMVVVIMPMIMAMFGLLCQRGHDHATVIVLRIAFGREEHPIPIGIACTLFRTAQHEI